jgi:hypothetical protein
MLSTVHAVLKNHDKKIKLSIFPIIVREEKIKSLLFFFQPDKKVSADSEKNRPARKRLR